MLRQEQRGDGGGGGLPCEGATRESRRAGPFPGFTKKKVNPGDRTKSTAQTHHPTGKALLTDTPTARPTMITSFKYANPVTRIQKQRLWGPGHIRRREPRGAAPPSCTPTPQTHAPRRRPLTLEIHDMQRQNAHMTISTPSLGWGAAHAVPTESRVLGGLLPKEPAFAQVTATRSHSCRCTSVRLPETHIKFLVLIQGPPDVFSGRRTMCPLDSERPRA